MSHPQHLTTVTVLACGPTAPLAWPLDGAITQ
ncbi:MAG: hypothetical protein RIQ97_143 [Pseudomonadota bacterium]|jgi:hypothetical protein